LLVAYFSWGVVGVLVCAADVDVWQRFPITFQLTEVSGVLWQWALLACVLVLQWKSVEKVWELRDLAFLWLVFGVGEIDVYQLKHL